MSNYASEVAQIREEINADLESIQIVHLSAFNSPAEANLVDLLRFQGKAVISLVAEIGSEIVGHILFSPVSIEPPAKGWNALGLAPVAVIPDKQRQGIGKALVKRGLERCRELGFEVVVVLGDPGYYKKFGFQRALDHGLGNEYQAGEHFMVLELNPGVLHHFNGLVKYAPEFNETGS